jgi:hypothetical protein
MDSQSIGYFINCRIQIGLLVGGAANTVAVGIAIGYTFESDGRLRT